MKTPKGYIIYLKNHNSSVEWAQQALASGRALGWDLELYEGVDGRTTSIEQHGLALYKHSKKSLRLMQRPGTLGCFLSQYSLWNRCVEQNQDICIFEHDVVFKKSFEACDPTFDVLKFEGFRPAKSMPVGQWWEGARAYILTPQGAKKIVKWIQQFGAMPADWCLNNGIVNVVFDHAGRVSFDQKKFSFTKDLK